MDIAFTLPIETLLVLGGVVISLLVSLVTTKVTKAQTKAYLLAVLALASQLLAEATLAVNTGTTFDLGQALLRGAGTLLVAIGPYHGLTAPQG